MIRYLARLFDTSDWPPRWRCGNWTALEGWLHITSDVLIFLAYAAIPAALFVLIRRRKDAPFPVIAWLFVAFILSCGVTHLVEASIFWWPAYRVSGLLKLLTAAVSVATAVALGRAMPEALALPGIRAAHAGLQAALLREQELSAKLSEAHSILEQRTSALAVRDRRLRDALEAALAFALAWEVESGTLLWTQGLTEAARHVGQQPPPSFATVNQLLTPQDAASLRAAAIESVGKGLVMRRRYRLALDSRWWIRFAAKPDPEVKGQPRTMTAMAAFLLDDGALDSRFE